ncbi:hypothetical protein WKK05_39460 (plasmid) [Nostoc sp. UHCC 0302]
MGNERNSCYLPQFYTVVVNPIIEDFKAEFLTFNENLGHDFVVSDVNFLW